MKIRKLFALLLALLMIASCLAGCGGDKTEPKEDSKTEEKKEDNKTEDKKEDVTIVDSGASGDGSAEIEKTDEAELVEAEEVTISVSTDIVLSPWGSWSNATQHMMPVMYEVLGQFDQTKELGFTGILMKNFEWIEDGYGARIEIYDYITDSAGNKITIDDVIYSFEQWMAAKKSVKVKLIESMTKINDYTFELMLNTDAKGEMEGIICNQVMIVSKAAFEASADGFMTAPVTTARYKVVEFVDGAYAVLEKRDDYWQTDESLIPTIASGNAKRIRYEKVTEASQVSIALETGKLDLANVSASEATRFLPGGSSSEGFTVIQSVDPFVSTLVFNCNSDSIFANEDARKAVTMAVDVDGIIDGVYNGLAKKITHFTSYAATDFNPAWEETPAYTYDLAKAQELAKNSGLLDYDGSIRVICNTDAKFNGLGEVIQQYLLQLGCKNVEYIEMETASFDDARYSTDGWEIMITSKNVTTFTSEVANIFHSASPSYTLDTDTEFDEIIDKCRAVATHDEYIDDYVYYLADHAKAMPLFCTISNYVCREGVASLWLNYKGNMMPQAFTYTAEFNNG